VTHLPGLSVQTATLIVPLDIWPTVSIRRPHTDTWHVLIQELGGLEEWVRTVAC
jgi:hypothetical protein